MIKNNLNIIAFLTTIFGVLPVHLNNQRFCIEIKFKAIDYDFYTYYQMPLKEMNDEYLTISSNFVQLRKMIS